MVHPPEFKRIAILPDEDKALAISQNITNAGKIRLNLIKLQDWINRNLFKEEGDGDKN